MIKKVFTMTAFMLLTTITYAQQKIVDNREKVQIGLKAGLSYSNVYDATGEEFDADSKLGFTGGTFLKIPISRYLGVQPEVLIVQKGFKGSGNLFGFPYNFKRTTTFLEIPVLLALKTNEFITLLAGPQFDYLINQRDVFTSSAVSYDQEQEFKNDNIRKNILGAQIGMDINLNHTTLSGRIGWDIQTNKGDGSSSTPRYKNVCAQMSFGYRLF